MGSVPQHVRLNGSLIMLDSNLPRSRVALILSARKLPSVNFERAARSSPVSKSAFTPGQCTDQSSNLTERVDGRAEAPRGGYGKGVKVTLSNVAVFSSELLCEVTANPIRMGS